MMTCNGTTSMPSCSASAGASEDVESVTIATRGMSKAYRRLNDDADELGRPHDDLADLATVDRAYDVGLGQREGRELLVRHVGADLNLAAHFAQHLHDARHRGSGEVCRVGDRERLVGQRLCVAEA